jgi:TolA-binding protein
LGPGQSTNVAIVSINFRLCLVLLVTSVVWLNAAASEANDSLFREAARSYQQGNWQEAATKFNACLSEDPRNSAARFYLAECHTQLANYAAAYQGYLELLEARDEALAARALFRAGETAWLDGNLDEAEANLGQFVRLHPHHPSAAYAFAYLGDMALDTGNPTRAAAAYRTVVDSYGQSDRVAKARVGLARSLLKLNRPDQVPLALGRVTAGNDQTIAAEGHLLLGRAAYDRDQFEDALKHFRSAWRTDQQGDLARRARLAGAWSLWRLGRFEEIDLEISPLQDDAQWLADYYYLMGMAAYGLQDWAQGSQLLGAAIAAGPEHPNQDAILFYHGECCFEESRFDEAKQSFQQLTSIHPQSVWLDDALWGLARVARAADNTAAYQAAILQLRLQAPTSECLAQLDLPKSRRGSSVAHGEGAQILDEAAGLQRDGRHDSALAAYHQLIDHQQLGPLQTEALRRAARLHQQLHQYREAGRLWEQLLSDSLDSTDAVDAVAALAQIHDRAGQPVEAKARREELLAKFPQSAQSLEAAYWLARAAADENDSQQAATYTVWLLDELEAREELTEQQHQLWARAVSLHCQQSADRNQWQVVRDIASDALPHLPQGADQVRVEFWLAESEFRIGQFDTARERLAQLDSRTRGISEAWVAMVPLRRAQLAARRQQWTEVLKLVNRIDQEHPDFPLQFEVDYLHGRALAGRGEMSAARAAYRRVLNSASAGESERVAVAQWMIGETFFHQRNYPQARAAYQAVIERQAPTDWQSRAALQVGKCWELENQWDKAEAIYQQALTRWPDAEPEKQIQARLKWAQTRTSTHR